MSDDELIHYHSVVCIITVLSEPHMPFQLKKAEYFLQILKINAFEDKVILTGQEEDENM